MNFKKMTPFHDHDGIDYDDDSEDYENYEEDEEEQLSFLPTTLNGNHRSSSSSSNHNSSSNRHLTRLRNRRGGGSASNNNTQNKRQIPSWLIFVAGMVFASCLRAMVFLVSHPRNHPIDNINNKTVAAENSSSSTFIPSSSVSWHDPSTAAPTTAKPRGAAFPAALSSEPSTTTKTGQPSASPTTNNDPSKNASPNTATAALELTPPPPGSPSRAAPLDSTNMKTSFVHISKCAGASWIVELKSWITGKNFYPLQPEGAEHSILFTRHNHPSQYVLTSVKSPRHHVWSQFTECKYDNWGKQTTANRGFPRSGDNPQADLRDFEHWLDAFVQVQDNGNVDQPYYSINRTRTNGFGGCYHPSNYIARHFTVDNANPHHVVGAGNNNQQANNEAPPADGSNSDAFEPSLKFALQQYWSLDWVAVAELYAESKCLLYYRFAQGELANTNTNSKALDITQSFLQQNCMCPPPASTNTVHKTHHAEGHRSSMRDGIAPQILEKIATLTQVDVPLYKHSLVELMKELAWLETQLGRQVLCDSKLESLNYELEYLELGNLTDLYHDLKKQV